MRSPARRLSEIWFKLSALAYRGQYFPWCFLFWVFLFFCFNRSEAERLRQNVLFKIGESGEGNS